MGFFISPFFLAFLVFLVGMLGISLPLFLSRSDCTSSATRESALHFGTLFSAGVLLAGGLVHLLPDAQADFSEASFPWASFISGFGFLLILVIDAVVGVVVSGAAEEKMENYADEENLEPETSQSSLIRKHPSFREGKLCENDAAAQIVKSKFALVSCSRGRVRGGNEGIKCARELTTALIIPRKPCALGNRVLSSFLPFASTRS